MSSGFVLVFVLSLALSAETPVATLPSALFYERFFTRCKLGVLVSAGAATCLSTSLPSQGQKLGQAINAVTGTRRLGFVLPIYWTELRCYQHGSATISQRFVNLSAHPQAMQQDR